MPTLRAMLSRMTFGAPFQLLDSRVELHTTPWDIRQQFVYCFCRRVAARP